MFCPHCGSEERQVSQFCRACGRDLRVVRATLERPDSITASAVSARDEIARAIAEKIRELKKGSDLAKLTEEVLPEIEKFLESPQQRRLRGIRQGVMMSAIGLGATLFFWLMGLAQSDSRFLIGLGVTAFLIGIGLIINALLFTVPKRHIPELPSSVNHQALVDNAGSVIDLKATLTTAEPLSPPASVTEQTTHHLADSPAGPARVPEPN